MNVVCSRYEQYVSWSETGILTKIEDNPGITLGLLSVVEKNSAITQRAVSRDLGIALGLANTYLKRCIKKGLIKMRQAPANRYAYYLTPRGFSEKARLTGEYLSQGFQFFRLARSQLLQIFNDCDRQGLKKIAFHGLTDITEIALLSISEFDLKVSGIVDESSAMTEYTGIRVFSNLDDLPPVDAIIITDLGDSRNAKNNAAKKFEIDRIFVPELLVPDIAHKRGN